ncbi:MAG: hypothetical protein MI753_10305 [Hyphomicrobiales bacterium]|nr:hypothetical protein [Hyphomicrobiales bacterium]
MSKSRTLAAALAGAMVLTPAAAVSAIDAEEYLARFEGTWEGGGSVIRNVDAGPLNVSCQVTGRKESGQMSIAGQCRAALIFSRAIGADLTKKNGRFVGTYVGSIIGPAQLAGSKSGDSIRLAMTWPEPVNGDTTATMILTNDGTGTFTMVVADEIDGETVETTRVSFSRR